MSEDQGIEQLSQLRRQAYEAGKRNEVLSKTLKAARDELASLKSELLRMSEPPNNWATVIAVAPGGEPSRAAGETTRDEEDQGLRVDVWYSGRMMRLAVSPSLGEQELRPGRLVRLSEGLVVIDVGGYGDQGTVMAVKELLGADRVLLGGPGEDEKVYTLAAPLRQVRLRPGDSLLCDTRNQVAFERVEKPEVQSLMLEVVPDISYSDIGGLEPQIAMIKDAVEMPFVHPELFREHGLKPPKGILLYGPPGCGKTLIAKAVAHSLAERTRTEGEAARTSYFLNIKGPELLDKYVGETERQLRQIFARAREKATDGSPVVVFFDEMDSLFRTRGTGVSSDVETTIVPQLLSEIDGVERLDNVIVIGASNREDMIDPAILRPGRLDVKIRIERPDRAGAADIFSKYLTPDLPLHASEVASAGSPEGAVAHLIAATVDRLYSREEVNRYLEISYADGSHETLYFGDFASGAMVQNIVDRAKKAAIKSYLASGEWGLRTGHLLEACTEEFREHEDLPNTSNPDEWARISGRKGERVTHISVIRPSAAGKPAGEGVIETVSPVEGLL